MSEYVRTEHVMRMEEAVRKMTSLAASRVGLMDRGVLRPGMMADIAIFDPATIQDVATYQDPLRYSVGVKDVFVNGRPVVLDGKITEERCMAQLRARTPQIMRRHLGKSEFSRVLFHHMPDFSFGYAATPAAARS